MANEVNKSDNSKTDDKIESDKTSDESDIQKAKKIKKIINPTSKSSKKVKVLTKGGEIPFSIGYLADALLAIGLTQNKAYSHAYSISLDVSKVGISPLGSEDIMKITQDWYEEKESKFAKRVEILNNDLEALKPMVILLGGVTGIGKSTLAQLLSARLGIKSMMGTDLIREVLRVTLSSELMPTLHTSSYIAHQKLDTSFLPSLSKTIIGFEEQARSVIVGIEAAIEQTIEDNEILIIEGVHLVPGLIRKKLWKSVAVIPFQLVLEDEEAHHSRLYRREKRKGGRGTTYSDYFSEIREIQEYLIDQAIKYNVPLIEVEDDEKALSTLINKIWDSRPLN